jgi:tetratricopeptide (TPR) repeat protein
VFVAQVFDFEWNGDFAEARNFSLTKADGDWILIMDADEKISPQDYKRFRKLVGKKSYGLVAYSIITRNYCNMANTIGWIPNSGQYASEEAGLGWLSSEKVRLFSNNRQFKFVGAVHEMVDPVLKRHSVDIKKCPIPVHHYGRLNTDKLARKDQAYYEIGLKKLKENGGGDIGAVRELAIQATVLQRNSEAVDLWEKFLSLQPRDEAVADAYLNMVSVYIRMQEYGTALELARKAVSLKPQLKEAHYNLGITELYSGNAEAAFNTFKKLAKNHPGFPPAQFMLTASNHCRNGSADASINFRQLKRSAFGPVLTYSVTELAEGLMAAGQPLFAFGLLKKTIEEKIVSKTIMKLYAECVVKVKEVDSNAHNQVLGL